MSKIYETALEYIKRGWKVLPIYGVKSDGSCECGSGGCRVGKHPSTKNGVKDASDDIEIIKMWFLSNQNLNIGIATGEISGITVVDIDINERKNGIETWQKLISEYGEIETLTAMTGSGGLHLIFKYEKTLKTSSNTLGIGVDIRNDNGYIVVAPSKHKSGNFYKWVDFNQKIETFPKHLLNRKIENVVKERPNNEYKQKISLKQVIDMLGCIPSDDRELWRHVGIILGREFNCSDEAWQVYKNWSEKYQGKKGKDHDRVMNEAFYEISQKENQKELTIATIIKEAISRGWAPKGGGVPIENFVYYAPKNCFIYRPTGAFWITSAVDTSVGKINVDQKIRKASKWIKENFLCTSMACEPNIKEDFIKGYDNVGGEILEGEGAAIFNCYRRPKIDLGDAGLAGPFLDHVQRVFSKEGDADQFLDYMSHRAQKVGEKPRFALVIAGEQGVGKDTCVDFCIKTIGQWNVANIGVKNVESPYNEYVDKSLVRISELSAMGDLNKWQINEQLKNLISGNPDFITVNPKYGEKFVVRMHCGVIITTNNLSSGFYIPEDDRKYDVIEASTLKEMGFLDFEYKTKYFNDLWEWFNSGGYRHVNSLLLERDISNFSAENGQRKTDAHRDVVKIGTACDLWFDDILEELGDPTWIRSDDIFNLCEKYGQEKEALKRKLAVVLRKKRFKKLNNFDLKCGRFRFGGKKVTVYFHEDAGEDFVRSEVLKSGEEKILKFCI